MTTLEQAARQALAVLESDNLWPVPHAANAAIDALRAALAQQQAENERLRGIVPEVLEQLNDELCEENREMLAALKSIMDTVDRHAQLGLEPSANSPVAKARAAIKKAEQQL